MRVMMYAPGIGLGHVRRCYNIAREVLKREPGASVIIVTDSQAAHTYAAVTGLDYLKLPSVTKIKRTIWIPNTIGLDIDQLVTLRSNILLAAFRTFAPDAVLVDHRPVGVYGELKPLLTEAAQRSPRVRLYLGLRDILDDPDVMWGLWDSMQARDCLGLYEAALIYGQPDFYDLASAMGMAGAVRDVVWNGYVAPPLNGDGPAGAQKPMVLMTGGAGADAFPVAEAFVGALPRILGATDLEAVIVTGPQMPLERQDQLRSMLPSGRVRIESNVEDATRLVRRASVIVSMAGYNSQIEALRWGKRTLVVPRFGPSNEQRMRARIFGERNLIRVIEPEELSSERVAEGVLQLLQDDSVPDTSSMPRLDGAERAAEVLLSGHTEHRSHVSRDLALAVPEEGV
ncbi:MAG: glycosyltransferase [Dehalococcoidia bacterium]